MTNSHALVAGLGCRRDCTLDELLHLLNSALAEHDLTVADLTALASSEHKADEPGLLQLAKHLGLTISFLPTDLLTRYHARLSETSAVAQRVTGSPSVAEASALAMAEWLSGKTAHLWITKRKSAAATVAVAGIER